MLSEEDEIKKKTPHVEEGFGIIEERSVLFEEQGTTPPVTRVSQLKKSVFFVPEELQDELNDVTYNEILLMTKRSSTSRPPESTSIVTDATEDERSLSPVGLRNKFMYTIRKHKQFFSVLLSIFIGFVIGFLLRLRETKYNDLEIFIIQFPGFFYIRIFSGLLVPLISTSVISALGRLNFKLGYELFWRFMFHTVVLKALAISIAVLLTTVMAPGKGITITPYPRTRDILVSDFWVLITDILRSAMPDKFFQMFYETYRTSLVYIGPSLPKDVYKQKVLLTKPENWSYNLGTLPNPNYMGVLIYSIIIGFALQRLQRVNRFVLRLNMSIENFLILIGDWYLRIATISKVFLLIALVVTYDTVDDPITHDLFPYAATLFTVVGIYVFFVIPFYFYIITFINPWPYIKKMHSVLFTAFTTRSSIVTLPSTLTYLEDDVDIAIIPSRLLVPLGTIINMSGSAINVAVTAIFMAQALERDLSTWDIITIWINSFFESTSMPPVPKDTQSITGFTDVLNLVQSVEKYEGIVTRLDRILNFMCDGFLLYYIWLTNNPPYFYYSDHFTTVINTFGNLICALIVHFLMVQSAQKIGRLLSVNEFLRRQEHARRISQLQSEIRLQKMSRDLSLQHSKESDDVLKKNEDLELVSVSSTLSETS